MSDNPFEPASTHDLDGDDYGPTTLDPVPLHFGEVFTRAWEVMRENLGIIIAAVGIQIGVTILSSIIGQVLQVGQQVAVDAMGSPDDAAPVIIVLSLLSLVVNLISGIVGLWLGLGAIRIFLNLVRGQTATVQMLFAEGPKLLPAIVIGIVVAIGTILGLVFLIVPGIIVALALQFANYVLVDDNADIGGALTKSWNMSWPHLWFLFFMSLILLVGGLLATLLTCFLAPLVLVIYVPVVQAVIFQSMQHQYQQQFEILS